MAEINLLGRHVMIFGAGRGIGRSIAVECAKAGALVSLAARTEAQVREVASECEAAGSKRVFASACDVADEASVLEFAKRAEDRLGPTAAMVAAAGIYGAIGPVDTTPPAEWRKAIEVNLIGTYHCIFAVVGGMKKRKRGKIVLFSGGGQNAVPNFSAYTASKGGVWRLTETLGVELAEYGIELNAVAPGLVNTQFLDDLLAAGPEKVGKELYEKSLKQKQEGGVPAGQAGECVAWLLSDASGKISGRTISARWDDYRALAKRDSSDLLKSDLYTFKRVVDEKGGTRF